jgi:hypothetical protein
MIAKNEKPRWFFYLLWILVTLLCFPAAFILDLVILRVIIHFVGDFMYVEGVRHITEDYLGTYTFIPIVGLLTGLLQYGLLRRYLPQMGGWVAATSGGWLLGAFLALLPGWLNWTNPLFTMDSAFIVMGLSIGAGQWLLLRRHLPRAGWWIAANVAGWGLLTLMTAGNSIGQLELFTLGFLPASVTALVLAFLMNQVRRTEPHGV